MQFTKSRKSSVQILLDGHAYNKHSIANYWRCSQKNTCKGLGHYQNGTFTLKTEHRCMANVGMVKAKVAKMDILTHAESSSQPTAAIVTERMQILDKGNFFSSLRHRGPRQFAGWAALQ